MNLLAKMLEKIPYKRISSKNALNHNFLKEMIDVKGIKRKFSIVSNISNYTVNIFLKLERHKFHLFHKKLPHLEECHTVAQARNGNDLPKNRCRRQWKD